VTTIAQVLATAHGQRVDIPVIGDSVTVGQGADAMSARYAAVLNGLLRSRFPGAGAGSGGGLGFIPLYSTGLTTYTWPVNVTGDTSTITLGPVRDDSAVGDAATWTWTAPSGSTSVKIMYYNPAIVGSFTYQVGSGSVVTVNNTGAGPNGNDGQLTSSIPISGGQVLTISFNTGDIFVAGIVHYAGDENNGVTVHALGHSGWTSDTSGIGWQQPIDAFDYRPAVSALVPGAGALGIFLGLNDSWTGGSDASAATFQSTLSSLISLLRGNSTLAALPLLIIGAYEQDRPMAGAWPGYTSAMQAVAGATGAQFVDLSLAMGPVVDDPGLYADEVHPNDSGHLLIAQTVFSAIAPPASGAGLMLASGIV
jgi:lysophospholipase L1-like esterase